MHRADLWAIPFSILWGGFAIYWEWKVLTMDSPGFFVFCGIPFVLMSRYLARGAEDSVICHEEEGAYLATRHLIQAGRRKLAYLYTYDVIYSSEMRMHGFRRACAEAGIPPEDSAFFIRNGQSFTDSVKYLPPRHGQYIKKAIAKSRQCKKYEG